MFTAQMYFRSLKTICPQCILICSKRSTSSVSDPDLSGVLEIEMRRFPLVLVHPNPRGRIRWICDTFLLGLMINVLMITETKLQ